MKATLKKHLRMVALALALGAPGSGCHDPADSEVDAVTDAGMDAAMDVDGGNTGDAGDAGVVEEDGGSDAQVAAPTFTAEVSENPDNPLSAFVDVRADVPVVIEVSVEGPGLSHTFEGESDAAKMVSADVWGMRADTDYVVTVTAETADGEALEPVTVDYTTAALPDDFPPIEVSGEAGPGFTMFSVFRWNPGSDTEWGLLVVVDQEGEVVWFHRDAPAPGDARLLDNGHILYACDSEKAVEIDWMGRVAWQWTAEELQADTIHHEIYPLDDGHYVFLSTALHPDVGGFLDSNDQPINEDVVSDVIVEVDADGAQVAAYDLFDLLEPTRILPDFYSPFWTPRYGSDSDAPRDWTHGNAVVYDESDDSFIVSLRHQDWLIKIDRSTGELVWRFGVDGDFTLEGDGMFQSRQHAPELLGDGRILLFDNGNANMESRAVIYDLDEENMTATQEWEFHDGAYAPFVGDADLLGTGNVLITLGGLVADGATPIGAPTNKKYARILEVTGEDDPSEVWRLDMEDTSDDPIGYTVYRAERLEALLP